MTLEERQAALVAALVAGAHAPPGFDAGRVRAAADALVRKRAGEVAAVWPLLASSAGPDWLSAFRSWAAGRPPAGPLRDGWDFARSLPALPAPADEELAAREVAWRYDGVRPPRPRRRPAARRCAAAIVLGAYGHVWRIPLRSLGFRNGPWTG